MTSSRGRDESAKNKSVVCELILFITRSSWREGIRELNSGVSVLLILSRDFLVPNPLRGKEKQASMSICGRWEGIFEAFCCPYRIVEIEQH